MTPTSELTLSLLERFTTITVVGCSTNPGKAAHSVPHAMQQYGWRIVPVHPRATEILGEPAYPTLADVPGELGLVTVFRPSAEAGDIVRQAVAAGAEAVWLQLGIGSAQARSVAAAAGIDYVEDRCLAVERARYGLTAHPAA
jgi:hypothetical protein